MEKFKIKIDIFSDVVCPWCYIGKKRLEKAIMQLQDEMEFQVTFLPYQLNPEIPMEGVKNKDFLIKKFGGIEQYEEITNHVSEVATKEGLPINFNIQEISPNTKNAHRLLWLGGKLGVQYKMASLLFKAYFEEGVDLSQKDNLVRIAQNTGLSGRAVSDFLDSKEGEEDIKSLLNASKKIGVTGVPFFIFNNKFGITGAQPSEIFIKVIKDIFTNEFLKGKDLDLDEKR